MILSQLFQGSMQRDVQRIIWRVTSVRDGQPGLQPEILRSVQSVLYHIMLGGCLMCSGHTAVGHMQNILPKPFL